MYHTFDTEIAKKYGINAAIIYQNFLFWICQNKANGRHFFDGRYWTYNSIKALSELFPYLTVDQIRRALDKLVDSGVLVKGNYNKSAYDRTCWYAFAEEPLDLQAIEDTVNKAESEDKKDNSINSTCEKKEIDSAKKDFPFGNNAEPIPDIKPNIKLDTRARTFGNSPPSPLSPHSTFEKFKNDFLRYYIKLTAITVSDINQINYFRNEIRRDELKNLFETSQGFYESEMEKAFEDAKKSQPKSRFFDFYDTLRILISERNQELVEIAKRSEEREKKRQAERLKWEAEERQMRADLERQAAEQGLTVEELLKIEEEELKRNFSSEFVGV